MISTAGLVDISFPQGIGYGFDKDVHDIKLQTDGKILISGDFEHYDYNGSIFISPYFLRLNTDGTYDSTFDITVGSSGFNQSVRTIYIQNDGKILAGGLFTQLTRNGVTYNVNRIIRFNIDGTVDNTFISGLGFNDDVLKIEVLNNNKIIVVGRFTQYDGNSYNRVVRLNSDGSIDMTFVVGTGIDGAPPANYVNDVIKQPDGKLILVGHFELYNGNPVSCVVRILSDGGIDTTFNSGTGINGLLTSVGIQSSGHIILGGLFTEYNGVNLTNGNIVRINSDGSFSNSFRYGLNDAVVSILIQSDNKIIVGGSFNRYYTSPTDYISAKRLIKFLADTSLDGNFYLDPNYDDVFLALALTPNDGYLFIGGDTNYPPANHFSKLYNEALITVSANTEYFMCLSCSGTTNTVSVPHAIYSDGSGRNIVQLNTVALGGPDGLYN